ncbi:MAG: hypothetical protein WD077_01230 [Bacteroidia bacterium]
MKKILSSLVLLLLIVSLAINFLSFSEKYKPAAPESLGKVTEINGIKVFMMSEPAAPYEELSRIEPFALTILRSPYDWASKFAEMAMKRRGDGLPVEGVIYKSGRSAILIRFIEEGEN